MDIICMPFASFSQVRPVETIGYEIKHISNLC